MNIFKLLANKVQNQKEINSYLPEILKIVAVENNVSIRELISQRYKNCAYARSVFIAVAFELGYTRAQIGDILNRHHSTIVLALQKVIGYYKYEIGFQISVKNIMEFLEKQK